VRASPTAPPAGASPAPDLDALFAGLRDADGIVIAVSGGPDSVALLHLLARWAAGGPRPPLVVATVDHGLRPESAAEAALVARLAAGLGLPHRVLPWSGPKPAQGLPEAAREARYALLAGLARARGASHLATAHTLDDQAETVLMRLSRGSGLAGLAGMRAEVERAGLRHVRPLLAWRKETLVALCRREGWAFVEDPSNRDARFARARWRRLMPLLADEGLTPERLARLAERARRAEDALDEAARATLERARRGAGPGLRAQPLVDAPFEIALRALALAVAEVPGAVPRPRLERLEAALAGLREAAAAGRSLRRTLAGILIALDPSGEIALGPEPPRHRGRYRRAPAPNAEG
jgi:tRNA(Ile)-lysidine synthase